MQFTGEPREKREEKRRQEKRREEKRRKWSLFWYWKDGDTAER
jgi:hypothetical protein